MMHQIIGQTAGGHSRQLGPLVVLQRQQEANGVYAKMDHTAAAAVLNQLCKGAVGTRVALTGADIQGLAQLAAFHDGLCLPECGSKQPVFCVVDVLAQTIGGVHHILCILNGGSQRLFADDVSSCVHRLDSYIVMQEVGHADVHQVAVTFCDGGVVVIVGGVALETIAVCQSFDAA